MCTSFTNVISGQQTVANRAEAMDALHTNSTAAAMAPQHIGAVAPKHPAATPVDRLAEILMNPSGFTEKTNL